MTNYVGFACKDAYANFGVGELKVLASIPRRTRKKILELLRFLSTATWLASILDIDTNALKVLLEIMEKPAMIHYALQVAKTGEAIEYGNCMIFPIESPSSETSTTSNVSVYDHDYDKEYAKVHRMPDDILPELLKKEAEKGEAILHTVEEWLKLKFNT